MRIEAVEALALEIPLAKDFGGSTYRVVKRAAIVTRLRTTDGVVGEVYNGDNREHGAEVLRIIREELAPLVVGEDASRIERLWERMHAITRPVRDRKLAMEAIACVDCAIWDAFGKSCGRSIAALLGGYRARMPILSIGGYYRPGATLADVGREMVALREVGMGGCKFKVGGLSPEADAERVAAARAAAGADFLLAVDANRGWDVGEAIRFARLVERHDIAWFEEPCHWYDDAAMMARVRQATRIPVTAGQSEYTAHGVRRLVDAGAVDIVNFDASEGGGVTEWRRVAGLCAVHGVRLAHHEEPQIALHLLSAVPHGGHVECFADPLRDPMWQELWVNRPPVRDGWIDVPAAPGFGIELDAERVARYRVG